MICIDFKKGRIIVKKYLIIRIFKLMVIVGNGKLR